MASKQKLSGYLQALNTDGRVCWRLRIVCTSAPRASELPEQSKWNAVRESRHTTSLHSPLPNLNCGMWKWKLTVSLDCKIQALLKTGVSGCITLRGVSRSRLYFKSNNAAKQISKLENDSVSFISKNSCIGVAKEHI